MDALIRPFVQAVADRLIDMLATGTAPWQKTWDAGMAASALPNNPVTGNRYKGINALYLMAQGQDDPRWMTYKQAESVGAQVRRGEKGTPIQYWKFSEERVRQDEEGRPLLDEAGKPQKYTVSLERPALFMATVFNAAQIDGLPAHQHREPQWQPVERAEQILRGCGARIQHGANDRAFYNPASDTIQLPDRASFQQAEGYYATALHELGHWTGHASRLGRDLAHPFGSEAYAREELRAEIASMLLGQELHIAHDPVQHAAYVGSWIKVIRDDPLEIFRAAADAEKIHDYVLAHEQRLELTPAMVADNAGRLEMDAGKSPGLHEEILTAEEMAVVTLKRATKHEHSQEAREGYQAASRAAFHFELPLSWNGRVKVVETTPLRWDHNADMSSARSEWTLIATLQDWSMQPLASYPSKTEADRMAQRLALVDAHAESNEFEKAAKLARLREVAVQRDPASRPEDIAAAREARKNADLLATQNDADLLRRVAEQERTNTTHAATGSPQAPAQESPEGRTPGQRLSREQSARRYLAVPYGERGQAKAAGAKWDRAAKVWYADATADAAKLSRWSLAPPSIRQNPAISAREEFAAALKATGCIVDGDHPVMDGKKHRITVLGERHSENSGSGFYVGHLDGYPAGYIKNNKTGVEVRWKAKGYHLSPEEKTNLTAQAAIRAQERSNQQADAQEAAAQRAADLLTHLTPARKPTPYMLARHIEPTKGALTDKEGQRTYLPATDANGKLWTVQVIQPDGTKRFTRESRKTGCFHAVGGLEAVGNAPVLLVAEGYATASSLAKAAGFATVAAFDAGNLPEVVQALHQKFPNKPVIVAGDNDLHLEKTQGVNPGRQKAEEAARSVGGLALMPVFGPGEQAGDAKRFKDFNDLASKSRLGEEGLRRQIKCAVDRELSLAHGLQATQAQTEHQHHRYGRVVA